MSQTSSPQLRQVRMLLFSGAWIYLAWGLIVQYYIPGSYNDWIGRASVSSVYLTALALTFFRPLQAVAQDRLVQACNWVLTLHYFYLCDRNGLAMIWIAGSFVLMSAVSCMFNHRSDLVAYAAMNSIAASVLISRHPSTPAPFFLGGLLTPLIVSYIVLQERLHLVRRLDEASRAYQRIFNAGFDANIVHENGTILEVNNAACLMFDEAREHVIGRYVMEWVAPQARPQVAQQIASGFQGTYSTWGLNHTDKELELECSVSLHTYRGRQVRLVALRDVTTRRRAERQMAAASRFAMLSELAAGVAHEINNPLAIIQGKARQLESLQNQQRLDSETATEISSTIRATVDRIASIVQSLQQFGRGAEPEEFEQVSVREIIEDALAICGERIRSVSATARIDGISADLMIECRMGQIAKALVNLINSSLESVVSSSDRWIRFDAAERDGKVEITLTDSAPSALPPGSSTYFASSGLARTGGLGLSIARGIIQSHHGSLNVGSPPSAARFVITLPRSER